MAREEAAAETTPPEAWAGGSGGVPRPGVLFEKAASGWAPGGARGNPQKQDWRLRNLPARPGEGGGGGWREGDGWGRGVAWE